MANSVYEKTCTVTCTDNDRVVEAEVDNFREKDSLNVFIATNKIHMKWNGRSIYIGNQFGCCWPPGFLVLPPPNPVISDPGVPVASQPASKDYHVLLYAAS